MTYSIDFRRRALLIKEPDQLSFEATANRFGVGQSSVFRGSKPIEVRRTRDKPATKIDMEALEQNAQTYPEAYQYERAERLGISRKNTPSHIQKLMSRHRSVL